MSMSDIASHAPMDTSPLLITNADAHSTTVEAYRMLRTSISFAAREEGCRTFLVTSTGRAEGKTITASNLALSLASVEGQRVLLLDCDLRIPTVGPLFGIEPSRIPLVDIADEHARFRPERLAEAVVAISPTLDVFASGPTQVMHPAEFLGSPRMDAILEGVRTRYDFVVIDSPPAGLVTDATVLGARVDAVLFVVGYAQTRRRFVKRTLRELRRADANVLGVLMTRSPRHRRHGLTTSSLGGEYYAVGT